MLDKIRHGAYIEQKNVKDLLFEAFKFVNDNYAKIDITKIEIGKVMNSYNWYANIYYEMV